MKNTTNEIIIKGARENNLQNINLTIPRDKFVVFTGLSGSGKSTLAFDTIFAEGQRRYLESLSSYARQFLGQMDKPDVDTIEGLSPAISIDQKTTSHNPRSTVGTVTEVHDYLRLLWSKIGVPHCPKCDKPITVLSTDEIVSQIIEDADGKEIEICAPVVRARKGTYLKLFSDMWDRGFMDAYIDGEVHNLDVAAELTLDRHKKHDIDIVVDSLKVDEENISRLFEAVEISLKIAEGLVKVRKPYTKKKDDIRVFNQKFACPDHPKITFPDLEPRLFSFNSPYGACDACEGLGTKKEIDWTLAIPDINKTIASGGVLPWSNKKKNSYYGGIFHAVLQHYHIPDNKRLRDLTETQFDILVHGEECPDDIPVSMRSAKGSTWKFTIAWKGIVGFLEDRYKKTESESVRKDIEQYMSRKPCSACSGSRYTKEVLWIYVGEKNIDDVAQMTITEAVEFFEKLELNAQQKIIGERIIKEVISRLRFLDKVGLGYLTMSRSAHTLSGGEAQRIRLASQIGSQLVGVLYILDEPSIGLHARDNTKLLETLLYLRDLGNTVVVIEHDEETMRASDFLVDIGPGAGKHGGRIVTADHPDAVLKNKKSLTAQYLTGKKSIPVPRERRNVKNKKILTVRGARENNLRGITVEFPLGMFTVVTGVSGSGKSTLVEEILYKATANKLMRSVTRPGKHQEIVGLEHLDKVIMIDQSPIGRTPRSNPATYTGVFTPIRELFAQTKAAKARGYKPGRFSFNVRGGRCDNCNGDGALKIEMQFMADVYLPCDVCKGKRYNSETLQVTYRGKSIADVLAMTVDEAVEFFDAYPAIYTIVKTLQDVGLGYIHLGQSATTLSGGEAQRVKLASELARRGTGKTLYILDEPTTGLHFDDVAKLLNVLTRLVDKGNTVVVIEHNMDVIKTADWIIDMGPEGGSGGGKVVIAGAPEEVIKYHKESHTAHYLRKILRKK
ncbi:MAG: excinuclease ABC subunit A [Candidatus Moraniibacteriota bacterium]|nr:MAG: excinuclease ABC subunit A [Candidatus Moranbacteria bacterium]